MTDFTVSRNWYAPLFVYGGETDTVSARGRLTPVTSTAVYFKLIGSSNDATLNNRGEIAARDVAIDTFWSPALSFLTSADQNIVVCNSGTIAAGDDIFRVRTTLKGGSATVDNCGTMSTTGGRGVNIQEYCDLSQFTLTNAQGGVIKSQGDTIRLTSANTGTIFTGVIAITNNGRLETTGTGGRNGQAIDLGDVRVTESGHVQITNGKTGVIQSADADAIRTSAYTQIANSGVIEARNGTSGSSGNDGIDAQSNIGVTVDNYAGGTIIGARHGITGTQSIGITNDGTIQGKQGSGINLDTASSTVTKIVNTAHGVITGTATATKDGDGIDVDGLIDLTNAGMIQAVGKYLGGDGFNEALAIGGGTVVSSGQIVSEQRAITVDNGHGGAAFAALALTNEAGGSIVAGNGAAAITIIGDKADTITNKGSIVGNVSTDAGNDVLNNAGSIKGDVSLGAGDDIANWTGDLTSAQRVDGGAGTDALNFDVVMSGTVKASFVNFETASGQILGQGGNDVIDLSSLTATGSLKLAGGDGNDIILGGTTDDLLIGGRGNDVLNGGAGKNVLIGGEGADTFILSTIKPDGGHDQIKDFETGIDTLQIDTKVFTALAQYGLGRLDFSELTFGAAAMTADQHLIYNAKKGHLLYDPDGVGGQEAFVILAALSNHVDLAASDIVLI